MALLVCAILASALAGIKAVYIIITGGILGYVYRTFFCPEGKEYAKEDK